MQLAKEMAARQERKRNQNAAELLGLPTSRTLKQLLDALHEHKEGVWSEGYKKEQDRYRRFWLDKLGDARLTRVVAASVERIVNEEAKVRDWRPRSKAAALSYLVEAFAYAEEKLKWIEPRHNLSAVTIPKAKSRSEAYTLEEARKLIPALERVDWRAGWMAEVALQTGRRLSAIRTLPERKAWVALHDGYAVLQFPWDTDKMRNTGQAVIAGKRALRLTARAMEDWKTPARLQAIKWMVRAEKAAGVAHRTSRGWHGFKRLYATLAEGQIGREKQSGTTMRTLDTIYKQDELAPKVELAKSLAGRLAGK